jgi:AraC-like DNA-binding protein
MSRPTIHRFWRSAELPFVESRCANDSTACYAPHAHATLSLGAVDGGQSVFSRGKARQRLGRGDLVLIPAGEVHCCNPEKDGRWSYQMLYLDEDWVRAVVGEASAASASRRIAAPELCRLSPGIAPQRLHARLSALNLCLFGAAPAADKEAAVVLFVADLFAPARDTDSRSGSGRLDAVKAMIAARCGESLTLDEMAACAGMSRYHFVRTFRRAVGMTPHAWQLDLRIQRARGLLDQGMALADAALQLGFADQSHFQRAFKARVAATPGEYRRNFLQD